MKKRCAAIALALVCFHAQACGPHFDYTYIVAASPKDRFHLPELRMAIELEKLSADTVAPGKGATLPEGVTLRSLCGVKNADEQDAYWDDAEVDETTTAELVDLYTALIQSGASAESATDLCRKYYIIRFGFDKRLDSYGLAPASLSIPDLFTVLSQLPKEFYLYFQGALAFHKQHYAEAAAHFEAILALPPEARTFRTTWALFMLGRIAVVCQREPVYAAINPDLAVDPQPWFDQLRAASAEGAIDTLNLAGGTYQQEALLASVKGDTVREMQSLARHVLVSNQETSAAALKDSCVALAEGDSIPPEVMADRLCRSALAAFAASHVREYSTHSERVLKAFQASDLERTPYEAGRLAWAAYSLGDFTQAAGFLAHAPEDPYSLWTQSRLHLREGNVEEALAALSKAAPQFPREEIWGSYSVDFVDFSGPAATLNSEQGVLMLTRDRYVEALDFFLTGKSWVDAAFVAENVLTLDELQIYFRTCREEDRHQVTVADYWANNLYDERPDFHHAEDDGDGDSPPAQPVLLDRLSALIGRRMLREGRFDGASDYFPEHWKPLAQAYAQHRKAGTQSGKKAERGRHLAQAGHLLRIWGIELIGYEADPDFAYTEGALYYGGTAALRQDLAKWLATDNGLIEVSAEEESAAKAVEGEGEGEGEGEAVADEEIASVEPPIDLTPLYPTAEERKRLAKYLAQPYQRWHYRYTAGQVFQEAADLLPDQREEKAQALYYGGTVLIKVAKDKEALAQMDKRYKALVKTCGTLEIGKAAAAAHWFPEEPESWSDALSSDALYAEARKGAAPK